MDIGVCLLGQLTDGSLPEGWLARAQGWLHETWANTLVASVVREQDGALALAFQLHPGADDVVVRAVDGQLEAAATTTGVGPGYHAHVCEVLQAMADEMAVLWRAPLGGVSDPTGFFETGSFERLQAQTLGWLRAEAATLLASASLSGASLGLSRDHVFHSGEAVVTPLGPRDRRWLEQVVAEPERGTDVFAWWEQGIGPRVLLGRALVLMWTEIRWRKPMLDTEIAQITEVLELLRQAQTASPGLDYPWREWAELQKLLRDRTSLPPFQGDATTPLIGYRRAPVRVRLGGGWSVEVPGSFAESWDERGVFTGWAEGKTLTVTTALNEVRGEDAAEGTHQGSRVELPELPPGYEYTATLSGYSEGVSEDGELLRRLRATVRVADRTAQVTAIVDTATEEGWALHAAGTLRFEGRG